LVGWLRKGQGNKCKLVEGRKKGRKKNEGTKKGMNEGLKYI
jgi:hypothetical protein